MSPSCNSLAGMKAMLQREMASTMNKVVQRSHLKALENAESYYYSGSPWLYDRTYKYAHAPASTGVMGGGNHLEAEIYMNPSESGYTTGTFSAQQVWEAVEYGFYGVLGIPGRWAQTESDIKKIISEEFSKFGK